MNMSIDKVALRNAASTSIKCMSKLLERANDRMRSNVSCERTGEELFGEVVCWYPNATILVL
jgi:hypothetical protein